MMIFVQICLVSGPWIEIHNSEKVFMLLPSLSGTPRTLNCELLDWMVPKQPYASLGLGLDTPEPESNSSGQSPAKLRRLSYTI